DSNPVYVGSGSKVPVDATGELVCSTSVCGPQPVARELPLSANSGVSLLLVSFARKSWGISEESMFDLLLLSLGACISGLVRMMGDAYATEITVMSDTPV